MINEEGKEIQQLNVSQKHRDGYLLICYELPEPCSAAQLSSILNGAGSCKEFVFNDYYLCHEFSSDENKYIDRDWMDELATNYFSMFPKAQPQETYDRLLKNFLEDEDNDKEQIVERYAMICGIKRMLKNKGITVDD